MPEHTIAENLTRLQNAKTAIGNAITAKGGTVGANDGLEDFATDIATIPSGGGDYIVRILDTYNNVSAIANGSIANSTIYNNIRRCNVADNGTISAFYGESTYTEDGSNGQVMVYIPKFYYKVEPIYVETKQIYTAAWYVADSKIDDSYKLHPAFLATDGITELDYFLIGAFEAVGQNDEGVYNTSYNTTSYKLGSVGGNTFKPTTNMTRATARIMAHNRGNGWYQLGIKQLMAVQMLFGVEYGFNSQKAVGWGIVSASSIANVGNTTGNTTSGSKANKTTPVSYRGIENLWGNVWKYVDGINYNQYFYISESFNFEDDTDVGYFSTSLTVSGTYASRFGLNGAYDWLLIPADSSASEYSSIGDYQWASNSGWSIAQIGGRYTSDSKAGLFSYDCSAISSSSSVNTGSRIMYIPQ